MAQENHGLLTRHLQDELEDARVPSQRHISRGWMNLCMKPGLQAA